MIKIYQLIVIVFLQSLATANYTTPKKGLRELNSNESNIPNTPDTPFSTLMDEELKKFDQLLGRENLGTNNPYDNLFKLCHPASIKYKGRLTLRKLPNYFNEVALIKEAYNFLKQHIELKTESFYKLEFLCIFNIDENFECNQFFKGKIIFIINNQEYGIIFDEINYFQPKMNNNNTTLSLGNNCTFDFEDNAFLYAQNFNISNLDFDFNRFFYVEFLRCILLKESNKIKERFEQNNFIVLMIEQLDHLRFRGIKNQKNLLEISSHFTRVQVQ